MEDGAVTLAGEDELDEEEEADGEGKVARPGLGLGSELAGAESGAGMVDFSRNGGCAG